MWVLPSPVPPWMKRGLYPFLPGSFAAPFAAAQKDLSFYGVNFLDFNGFCDILSASLVLIRNKVGKCDSRLSAICDFGCDLSKLYIKTFAFILFQFNLRMGLPLFFPHHV